MDVRIPTQGISVVWFRGPQLRESRGNCKKEGLEDVDEYHSLARQGRVGGEETATSYTWWPGLWQSMRRSEFGIEYEDVNSGHLESPLRHPERNFCVDLVLRRDVQKKHESMNQQQMTIDDMVCWVGGPQDHIQPQ